jgi:2-dehydropantoate 2-reductase
MAGGIQMIAAIIGAGSLGTIIGALISNNGGDVVLIDNHKEHVNALNRYGATITGKLDMKNVPVKAITTDEMSGIYDIVFYLVKQTSNDVALKQLLPHLNESSVVCTLQNGVPEDAVAEIVGRERTMGCAVGWGATWISPGISMLTSDPEKMTYDIGELDGRVTERLQKAAALLNMAGTAEITSNLPGVRWTKLLVNATFSGMSAALGCTFGDILDNEKALTCAAHIANETIHVVNSLGVSMEPIQGHDLKILAFKNQAEMLGKLPIYHMVYGPHRSLRASMLQDLEKGKKCEIDAINGVISQWGQKKGIGTPVNDQVVKIIKDIELGKLSPLFSNIDLFKLPVVP